MRIRNKISLVFFFAWLFIISVIFIASKAILETSYKMLEKQSMEAHLERTNNALDELLYDIKTLNLDWAHWDDIYEFAQNLNKKYIDSNLLAETHKDTGLDIILFFDEEGNYKHGSIYDDDQKEFVPLPEELKPHLEPDDVLVKHKNITSSTTGVLKLSQGYLLVSSLPILTSEKTGPIEGTMIMARYLNEEEMNLLRNNSKLPINLLSIKDTKTSKKSDEAYTKLTSGLKNYVQIKNQKTVSGYSLLKNIYNKPVGMFKIDIPRKIWEQGQKTINFYIASLALAGLFIIFLIWFLTKKILIDRLALFRKQITNIESQSKFASRINISGNDEVNDICKAVNGMLDVIQTSHNELGQRVEERTKELKEEIKQRKEVEAVLIKEEEKLDHLAHHDPLTGLANRSLFVELLNRSTANAERNNKKLAVFFLDLDNFKNINDVYGHSVGDVYLRIIGKEISNNLRETDILSRMGGDEFTFFTEFRNILEVERIAKKILQTITKEAVLENNSIKTTGSIGIATYPDDGLTVEELISNADIAMYRAKENGRDQHCYFKDIYNISIKKELRLETELHKAITNNELRLFLQPIMDLKNKKTAGVEALTRWQHPKFGLLSSDKFIPIAEKTNLILSVEKWILDKSCKFRSTNGDIHNKNCSFITVNFSSLQFRVENFVADLASKLIEEKINPKNFVVEITESTLMKSESIATENLQKLQELGVRTAIDNFGTGYSSLSYLSQFPISFLKIDRKFLEEVPGNKNNESIINAIIVLGHSLGLKIIAEGVETIEQLKYLVDRDCDFVQGFLMSRPLSEKHFLSALKENPEKDPFWVF